MMKRILLASSAAAMLAVCPAAFAQTSPSGGATQTPPERVETPDQKPGGAAETKPDKAGPEKTGPEKTGKDRSDAGKPGKEDKPAKDAKSSKDESKDEKAAKKDDEAKDKDAARDAGRDDKDGRKAGEETGDKGRADKDRADRDRGDRDADRAGSGDKSKESAGEVREEDRKRAESVRSRVDDGARNRIRDVAFKSDVRRADIDIRVDLGARLPRRVELYPIPDDIVAIVPAYRGYRYVVVGDDYCIIDPETYVIVDVIHRGGGERHAGGHANRLDLNNRQIEIIRREVRGKRFDYDGDLEVGVRLPSDITPEPFPDLVVSEVPEVRRYRYAMIEDEIAIISPDDPDVVFVIGD